MRVKEIIGRELVHEHYGLVLVTGAKKGSKKYVEVKCIQRKEGWNKIEQKYDRVMRVTPNPDAGPKAKTIYFDTHRSDNYGKVDTVHLNTLSYD